MTGSATESDTCSTAFDPDTVASEVEKSFPTSGEFCERGREQCRFAAALVQHLENEQGVELIQKVLNLVETSTEKDPEILVNEIESILAPIGEVARNYTVHYVGHAHIDMNWLWDFPETVHTTYRTFSTMFDIMDEYPDFRFMQSQVSTYEMMADHAPEVYEEIRNRIEAGQWEVAASTWVQGDKNMTTGESQARSFLYSREFITSEFDTRPTPIDFEPDTFGHPETVPKILEDAGIDYYYLGRSGGDHQPDREHGLYGNVPPLFRWRSSDGSEVVTFNGAELWYNGHIDPADVTAVLNFEIKTGKRDFLDLYGVGNHGGGPTRADIETIQRMSEWPVFPEAKSTTLADYFAVIEETGTEDLPVVEDELNFVFRGCYSSQSQAKQYNRRLEAQLPTAEAIAVVANCETDFDYPHDRLRDAWQTTLFNQFHDILPGAGISESYDHALGSYQEGEAAVNLVCDRAIEALDEQISLYNEDADQEGYVDEGVPVLVFNPTSYPMTDHVSTLVYDYPEDWDVNDLVAIDANGGEHPVQLLETNEDVWDKIDSGEYTQNHLPDPSRLMHDANFSPNFVRIALTVSQVPSYGYEIFTLCEASNKDEIGGSLDNSTAPTEAVSDRGGTVAVERGKDQIVLENTRYRLEADARRGAVTSLYDKENDRDYVPDGELFGGLTVEHEVPHDMSAWIRGQLAHVDHLDEGWSLEVREQGRVAAAIRWEREYRDSLLRIELRLPQDVPTIDWIIDANWRELGDDERGVPTMRVHFPVDIPEPSLRCDVPFGVTERDSNGMDVPANRWADIRDAETGAGVTVANDTTYGFSADASTLSVTLLRSTYSPDISPEVGRRQITCSLRPHGTNWSDADAEQHGRRFAHDPIVKQLVHGMETESFPHRKEFAHIDTDQAAITVLKRAANGDGVVLRIHELAGEPCVATVSVAWPFDEITETSLIEDEIKNTIDPCENGFTLSLNPYEVRTVLLRDR